MDNEDSLYERLCDDVLGIIFNFLDIYSVGLMRSVNKAFFNLSNNLYIIKMKKTLKDNLNELKTALKVNKELNKLFSKNNPTIFEFIDMELTKKILNKLKTKIPQTIPGRYNLEIVGMEMNDIKNIFNEIICTLRVYNSNLEIDLAILDFADYIATEYPCIIFKSLPAWYVTIGDKSQLKFRFERTIEIAVKHEKNYNDFFLSDYDFIFGYDIPKYCSEENLYPILSQIYHDMDENILIRTVRKKPGFLFQKIHVRSKNKFVILILNILLTVLIKYNDIELIKYEVNCIGCLWTTILLHQYEKNLTNKANTEIDECFCKLYHEYYNKKCKQKEWDKFYEHLMDGIVSDSYSADVKTHIRKGIYPPCEFCVTFYERFSSNYQDKDLCKV